MEPEPEPQHAEAQAAALPSSEVCAIRLKNYAEWVTRRLFTAEQRYFAEEARYYALVRQRAATEHAQAEVEAEAEQAKAEGRLPRVRPRTTSGSIDSRAQAGEWESLADQITTAESKLQAMREAQMANGGSGPGKTDDCLVIVLRPSSAVG